MFNVDSSKINEDCQSIKFEVFETGKGNTLLLIAEATESLQALIDMQKTVVKMYKSGFVIGELKINEIRKITKHTFLNYVRGGAEISLMIAVDFTTSNKDPSDPTSLHYSEGDAENDYVHALRVVGGILQYYDNDNRIPIYGFGARLPPSYNVVSHCFALNQNYFNPEVLGLENVIESMIKTHCSCKLMCISVQEGTEASEISWTYDFFRSN